MLGNRVLLHLDEAAGSTVFTDTSGLNNNGLCPATTGEGCPTAGATGRFNQALDFDGALSQTVTISDAIDPARYAIELWVNPTVVTDTSFILRTDALSGTLDHYSQLLGISGDRFVHLLNDGRTQTITSTTIVTPNTVRVVIKNQGPVDVPVDVAHEFWVDLYVNPHPVPTAVNAIWNDGRSLQGVVWGITVDALPSLRAGGSFTLTLGDAYYWPTLSTFPGGLAAGTPIYAQADSAHTNSIYGAVLENHEIMGLPYNNITGPVLTP